MDTFDRKGSWGANDEGYIKIKRPMISRKVNILVTGESVAAVQRSRTKNSQKEVEAFLCSAIGNWRKNYHSALHLSLFLTTDHSTTLPLFINSNSLAV